MQSRFPHLALRSAKLRRSAGRGGFTLVESVLALGIIAVVFTSLCGVLPVAFGSYRDAMDATYRANMVKKISSELEQAPFDKLMDAREPQYFGDQGAELTSAKDARFRVIAKPATEATVFDDKNSFLKPVTLEIYNAQIPGGTPLSKVTIFIADNGSRSSQK